MNTISRIVTRAEYDYFILTATIMTQLTGETWVAGAVHPGIVEPNGHQLQIDIYCPALALAIEYTAASHYNLPANMGAIRNNPIEYDNLIQYIANVRPLLLVAAGILFINLPIGLSEPALRDYLRGALHSMSQYRVWLGSPRVM